jgi:GNAT superfamily N-acetyltransferase
MPFFYITKKISSFRKIKNSIGLSRFLKRLIYSYHEEIMLVKNLNGLRKFSLKNGIETHNLKQEDIPALQLFRAESGIESADSTEEIYECLNNNGNGFIAKLDSKIIGYIWWGDNRLKSSFSDIDFKFYLNEIRLMPTDTYGFDFYISPRYRGGGHAIEFINQVFSILHDLGYKRNFGYVVSDKLPARWTYKLVGYEEIKKVSVRRFLLFIVFRNNKVFFDKKGRMAILNIR